MQVSDARFDADELELGALRERFLSLPIGECNPGINTADLTGSLVVRILLMLFMGSLFGLILAGVARELLQNPSLPPAALIALVVGVFVAGYQAWWDLYLPRRTYLAVHQRGIAFQCNLKKGQFRFINLRDVFSLSEIIRTSREKPTLSNSKPIRLHLTIALKNGESTTVSCIIGHIGQKKAELFFQMVKESLHSSS